MNTKPLRKGLTIVITFRNEKEWLEYTLTSIKETTITNPDIILINDHSTPDFDYEGLAKKYHCKYIYHNIAIGVAASRDEGVYNCKTEYFLLLDAHMDFYEQDWDKRILEILPQYPNSILFGQTANLKCQHSGRPTSFGANLRISETYGGLSAKWSTKDPNPDANIVEVPIVIGASYLSSVQHWNTIHGLYGLSGYGRDEELMSIKTWLSGGGCYLIKDWTVGHFYRKKFPYEVENKDTISNILFIYELLFDGKMPEVISSLKEKHGGYYEEHYKKYKERIGTLVEEEKAYLKTVFKHDIEYFLELCEKRKSLP